MNQETKNLIQRKLEEKAELLGSRNKLAAALKISAAQLSNVFNKDNWHLISSDMWKKLADAIELSREEWVIVETTPSRFIQELLEDAKEFGNTYHLVADTGSGKTVTAKSFVNSNNNAFRIECADHLNRKAFLSELLQSMGRSSSGLTNYDIMREIENEVIKMDNPLIILDEFDKLKDEVFYFFITIYNRLYGRCGIFLMSTDYMEKRTRMGLKFNKKGYQEYFSRIGKKFIYCPEPTSRDIAEICRANGIKEEHIIEKAINEYENDLRRVERIVHSHKRKAKKQRKEAI